MSDDVWTEAPDHPPYQDAYETEPVTPDREALIERARVFFHMDIARGLVLDDDMVRLVDDLLPLLADALDRARQQGRNEAADAIEAERDRLAGEPWQVCEVYGIAVRLARGGPNRKDEE